MKTASRFQKQVISTDFDQTIESAPRFEGWACERVENCHTNGLSVYFTYTHSSGVIKVVVRQSDHFARFANEKRGLYEPSVNTLFPAVLKVDNFLVFEKLNWVEGKSREELIAHFCKVD